MRIEKISFLKHEALEGLELDFCINGKPAPTILIAGENGTGKTSILNSIYRLSSLSGGHVIEGEHSIYIFLALLIKRLMQY